MATRICIFRLCSVLLLLWLFASAAYAQTHVFARGADGTRIHKAFDGEAWTEWESLGGQLFEGAAPDSYEGEKHVH